MKSHSDYRIHQEGKDKGWIWEMESGTTQRNRLIIETRVVNHTSIDLYDHGSPVFPSHFPPEGTSRPVFGDAEEYIEISYQITVPAKQIYRFKDILPESNTWRLDQCIYEQILSEYAIWLGRSETAKEEHDTIMVYGRAFIRRSVMFPNGDERAYSIPSLGIVLSRQDAVKGQEYIWHPDTAKEHEDRIKAEKFVENKDVAILTDHPDSKIEYLMPSGEKIPQIYRKGVKEPILTINPNGKNRDDSWDLLLKDAVAAGVVFSDSAPEADTIFEAAIKNVHRIVMDKERKENLVGDHHRGFEGMVSNTMDYEKLLKVVNGLFDTEKSLVDTVTGYLISVNKNKTEAMKLGVERNKIHESLAKELIKERRDLRESEVKIYLQRLEVESKDNDRKYRNMYETMKLWPHFNKILDKLYPMVMDAFKKGISGQRVWIVLTHLKNNERYN